jgi:hypothetical protein
MKRKKRISYCGIDCSICPVYVATEKRQKKAQIRIAKLWSDQETHYESCEISCKGCHEPWGKKFRHCAECEVRACARKKLYTTCADCPEYPCEKLNNLYANLDKKIVRINLDTLK